MMNDHLAKLCDELRAELGALHEKMQILEAKQAESKDRAFSVSGQRFLKNILITLIPLLGLLAAGDLLSGEGAGEALFIDKDGNATFSEKVGIGKTAPSEKLEVTGGKILLDGNQQIKFTESDASNNLKLQLWGGHGLGINPFTLFYAANGKHSWRDNNGTNERMALTTGADGGLTVTGTLDVAGPVRLGKGVAESWFPFRDNNAYISGNQTIIRSDSSGNHKEFVRINENGNVGIGATPDARLDVAGTVRLGKGVAESWFPYTDNNAYISGKETIIRSGTEGNHKEFVRINENGNVGIGTTAPGDYKLNINGKTKIDGTLEVKGLILNGMTLRMAAAGGVGGDARWNNGNTGYAVLDSDIRLKTDIHPVPTALEKVRKLRGVTYHWNQKALNYFTSDVEKTISAGPEARKEANRKLWQKERDKRYKELSSTNVGVIAQDVESVLPEAVSTDEKGYKSVRYHYLIPLLIEAVKEQDKTFQELAQIVARQHAEIKRLTVAQQTVQHQ